MQFAPLVKAEGPSAEAPSYELPPDLVPADRLVYISVWINDMYGYDYKDGSYTFDFFVFFSWSDKNITSFEWLLMNGYPIQPNAKMLIASGTQNNITTDVWRVRALFDIDVVPVRYPFDSVELPIKIQPLLQGYNYTLTWLESQSGISEGFVEVGWDMDGLRYSVSNESYPYQITMPMAEMDLVLTRSTYAALYSTIIPPIIFCVVSAFSFAFKIEDDSGFAIRIGLNTSMLITAVLFNMAEMDKMPPITELSLYTIFSVSVLLFISMNLITTIAGYMALKYKEDNKVIKTINRLGLVASIIVPLTVIGVIYIATRL